MTPGDQPSERTEKATPDVPSVQVLRAIAAGMVLMFHTQYMLDQLGGYPMPFSNTGAAGVDVFFVISGFIMAYITRHGRGAPADFLARRLIRIGPPYWLYTTITLAILVGVPGAFTHLRLDWGHVALSFGFLLSNNNEHVVGTLLGVGWTVCFEAYFYLLCAAAMGLSPRGRTVAIGVVILLGAALQPIVAGPPFLQVVFSELPLEFLAGYLFGRTYVRGVILPAAPALASVGLACMAIGMAGHAGVVSFERDPGRVLYFGVPSALLVVGLVSFDAARRLPWPRLLVAIGDASYSLYLSHQFVLYAVGKVWRVLGLDTAVPAIVLFSVAMAACLVVAQLSFWLFERPVTGALNAWWAGRRVVAQRLLSVP